MSEFADHPDDQKHKRSGVVDHTPDLMRAVVVTPVFARLPEGMSARSRTPDEQLVEAVGLAMAIDLVVVDQMTTNVSKVASATLLTSGKVEEIGARIEAGEAGLAIIDAQLTPVQQRNLEREWKVKVLDRTGLILEIFGRRAQTKEGRLQVDLAHLNYQRGRLVRSWTHLERQRGGAGFLGGPGETQIEADRRILREKIKKLERELEQVRRTRTLHRAKRKKVPLPIVACVGYTNAGKSTLFNRMTGAEVLAQDMLFATLDPTLRRVRLPGGTWIILSDTVGFISDLPTHLVAAFRATLEEVQEADVILHVRDVSDSQNVAQFEDVNKVLDDLDVNIGDGHVIEVFNKIDALNAESRAAVAEKVGGNDAVAVSALQGTGIDNLLALIERRIVGILVQERITVPVDRFADSVWLHENAMVTARTVDEDGAVTLDVQMTEETRAAWQRRQQA